MNEPPAAERDDDLIPVPWAQRVLDNLWVLLALSVLIPALLYLGWGLWELAELDTWPGG